MAGRTFWRWGWRRRTAGRPAEASSAEGKQTYAVLVEMLIELIRETVDGR